MASITIRRHPATIYYFLCHHFLEKGLSPDLKVFDVEVRPTQSGMIAAQAMRRVCDRRRNNPNEDLIHDITFESDDEELLVWLSLAIPEQWKFDD